jgi:hypothetical protein
MEMWEMMWLQVRRRSSGIAGVGMTQSRTMSEGEP